MEPQTLTYKRQLTPMFFAGALHEDLKWTINYILSLLEKPEVKAREQKHHVHSYMRSDEELEDLLSDHPMLREDMMPETSDEDYKAMVKNMHKNLNVM